MSDAPIEHVVHQDSTQDHLSANADEAVVADARERLEEQQAEFYDYEAAAAEVAAEPSETAPTRTFGSPDHDGEPAE